MLSLRKPDSDKEMFFAFAKKGREERRKEKLLFNTGVLSATNSLLAVCLESKMSHWGNAGSQKNASLRWENYLSIVAYVSDTLKKEKPARKLFLGKEHFDLIFATWFCYTTFILATRDCRYEYCTFAHKQRHIIHVRQTNCVFISWLTLGGEPWGESDFCPLAHWVGTDYEPGGLNSKERDAEYEVGGGFWVMQYKHKIHSSPIQTNKKIFFLKNRLKKDI